MSIKMEQLWLARLSLQQKLVFERLQPLSYEGNRVTHTFMKWISPRCVLCCRGSSATDGLMCYTGKGGPLTPTLMAPQIMVVNMMGDTDA